MWNGINWRKFPRIQSKIEIDMLFNGQVEHMTKQTENIGCGGVCVILDKAVNKFEKVGLKLDLDDNQPPITCDGRVIWAVKKSEPRGEELTYDVGIDFLNCTTADRERIEQFISNR